MTPWFFNVYMEAIMKDVKIRMGRREESGDCLASCMQMTEEELTAIVGRFIEVCRGEV